LGGVRFEQVPPNGINNFMAVMLTEGTEKQSSLEITKKIERMASLLNAFAP